MELKINSLENIREAAREFVNCQLSIVNCPKIFAFYGKMGAGKTTFIKAICEELGVEDVITSPTFAIVNEYEAHSDSPSPWGRSETAPKQGRMERSIFHFDFYRIKKLEEVYDMGYEDYFYSGSFCFIEWPELIEGILPEDTVKVTINTLPDGSRTVSF